VGLPRTVWLCDPGGTWVVPPVFNYVYIYNITVWDFLALSEFVIQVKRDMLPLKKNNITMWDCLALFVYVIQVRYELSPLNLFLSIYFHFSGYYCPKGQTVRNPNSYQCPVGYYCPTGSEIYQLCGSGMYQDQTRQWECKLCPEGFYCDNALAPIVNYTLFSCPEGKDNCFINYHIWLKL